MCIMSVYFGRHSCVQHGLIKPTSFPSKERLYRHQKPATGKLHPFFVVSNF